MTKKFVSDDMLGKIAIKQAEVFRRAKEGNIEPRYLLDTLQKIIEGNQQLAVPWAWSHLQMSTRSADPRAMIIDLEGELNEGETSVNFRKQFEFRTNGPRQKNVILNCRNLTSLDKSGVAALTNASLQVALLSGRMCLSVVSSRVRTKLEETKTNLIIDVYQTDEEAVASFE